MSKKTDINNFITINQYSKKYNVGLRKVYRWIHKNKIVFKKVNSVFLVYDSPNEDIKNDNRFSNVKTLTTNDNILTLPNDNKGKTTDNQEDSNVKTLTIDNDNILTLDKNDIETIVKVLIRNQSNLRINELELLEKLQKKLSISRG